MDIETFVKESLVAIALGVKEANNAMHALAPDEERRTYFILQRGSSAPVSFDVAVAATKEGGGGLAGKLNIAVAEVSLDGKGKMTQENVSRIKFEVHVDFSVT
jgi:hypothetical protein